MYHGWLVDDGEWMESFFYIFTNTVIVGFSRKKTRIYTDSSNYWREKIQIFSFGFFFRLKKPEFSVQISFVESRLKDLGKNYLNIVMYDTIPSKSMRCFCVVNLPSVI